MIYYVYVVQNRKVEAFERPIVTFHQKDDFIEAFKRDYLASSKDAQEKLKECVVYECGTFDDNTGKLKVIELNPIFDGACLEVFSDGK